MELSFEMFSISHFGAVAGLFLLTFLLFITKKRWTMQQRKLTLIERLLAMTLLLMEVLYHVWLYQIGSWNWSSSLPLELCSISVVMTIILLWTGNKYVYDFVFYAGIGGALQAVITPDLYVGFPHFRYFHFFYTHFGIILTALYFTWVKAYRPTFKGIIRTMIALNVLLPCIFVLNILLQGNYMFLLEKPANGSILDFLGPYPWYILSLEMVAFLMFLCLWILFRNRVGTEKNTINKGEVQVKIDQLTKDRISEFVEYCKKHKTELDDSYLYDEDLKNFEPNDDNPTYIVTNQQGNLVGAVSLMIDDYNKRGRKARFRIFHSEMENLEYYSMLMQAILKHTKDFDKVFLFVPFTNKILAEFMEGLNFNVERYSFVLIREEVEVPDFSLPKDYNIRPFQNGNDEEFWCEVRNAAFATLQGSETPITPEMVQKMMVEEDYIDGGSMILYHQDKPVGVIRGTEDEYEDSPIMNIGPIAIIPEYQGKGLGRSLLRAALHFAKEKSYAKTILCVNADNERAKELYIQEGFKQVEAVICYTYELNK